MMRCRTLGKVVAMEFSFHEYQQRRLLVLHFVDEASRFHHATVVGPCPGNCTSERLVELVGQWTTLMGYPARWHVDSEGCFKGDAFIAFCSQHEIEIAMCAGQAHWQNGMVERHIGVFKNIIDRLIAEETTDLPNDAPTAAHVAGLQKLVLETAQNKNAFGRYGGSSPSQWTTGRRSPTMDVDDPAPMDNDDLTSLQAQLSRRSHIADLFHKADAKATLALA